MKNSGAIPAGPVGVSAAVLALLVLVLAVEGVILIAPLITFSWLLVIHQKGYLLFGLPLFVLTTTIYFVRPGIETAMAMFLPMIILACLPARRRSGAGWSLASRNGSLRAWFLPASPEEDTGAITGDSSTQLLLGVSLALILGIWAADVL